MITERDLKRNDQRDCVAYWADFEDGRTLVIAKIERRVNRVNLRRSMIREVIETVWVSQIQDHSIDQLTVTPPFVTRRDALAYANAWAEENPVGMVLFERSTEG